MRCRRRRAQRKGKVVVLIALLTPVLAGMGAFALDAGYIVYTRSRLQAAAEAAALAAVDELPDTAAAVLAAQQMASHNFDNAYPNIVSPNDIEFGVWGDGGFVAAPASEANAVRVTAQRSDANGNSLALFLGHLLGRDKADVSAECNGHKAIVFRRFIRRQFQCPRDLDQRTFECCP